MTCRTDDCFLVSYNGYKEMTGVQPFTRKSMKSKGPISKVKRA